MSDLTPSETMNLAKFLAASEVASRRASAEIIKSGRVSVNCTTVLEPGFKVTDSDSVLVDGKRVSRAEKKHYIMLNKPRGYVCTSNDPHAGKRAIDLVATDPPCRLFSAGRLDKDSEGMLLLSNDGDYVAKITHPRYGILKRYEVKLAGELSPADCKRALDGIMDNGELLRFEAVKPLGGCRYEVTLNEGKKREIRRLSAALGAPTERLKRISTGNLQLGKLPSGQWRELTDQEIELSLSPGLQ